MRQAEAAPLEENRVEKTDRVVPHAERPGDKAVPLQEGAPVDQVDLLRADARADQAALLQEEAAGVDPEQISNT